MKKGSMGNEVKVLQGALHLYPDGIFGKLTEEAAELVGDDTTLKAIRERERERWERRKRHQYGAHKTEKDKDK